MPETAQQATQDELSEQTLAECIQDSAGTTVLHLDDMDITAEDLVDLDLSHFETVKLSDCRGDLGALLDSMPQIKCLSLKKNEVLPLEAILRLNHLEALTVDLAGLVDSTDKALYRLTVELLQTEVQCPALKTLNLKLLAADAHRGTTIFTNYFLRCFPELETLRLRLPPNAVLDLPVLEKLRHIALTDEKQDHLHDIGDAFARKHEKLTNKLVKWVDFVHSETAELYDQNYELNAPGELSARAYCESRQLVSAKLVVHLLQSCRVTSLDISAAIMVDDDFPQESLDSSIQAIDLSYSVITREALETLFAIVPQKVSFDLSGCIIVGAEDALTIPDGLQVTAHPSYEQKTAQCFALDRLNDYLSNEATPVHVVPLTAYRRLINDSARQHVGASYSVAAQVDTTCDVAASSGAVSAHPSEADANKAPRKLLQHGDPIYITDAKFIPKAKGYPYKTPGFGQHEFFIQQLRYYIKAWGKPPIAQLKKGICAALAGQFYHLSQLADDVLALWRAFLENVNAWHADLPVDAPESQAMAALYREVEAYYVENKSPCFGFKAVTQLQAAINCLCDKASQASFLIDIDRHRTALKKQGDHWIFYDINFGEKNQYAKVFQDLDAFSQWFHETCGYFVWISVEQEVDLSDFMDFNKDVMSGARFIRDMSDKWLLGQSSQFFSNCSEAWGEAHQIQTELTDTFCQLEDGRPVWASVLKVNHTSGLLLQKIEPTKEAVARFYYSFLVADHSSELHALFRDRADIIFKTPVLSAIFCKAYTADEIQEKLVERYTSYANLFFCFGASQGNQHLSRLQKIEPTEAAVEKFLAPLLATLTQVCVFLWDHFNAILKLPVLKAALLVHYPTLRNEAVQAFVAYIIQDEALDVKTLKHIFNAADTETWHAFFSRDFPKLPLPKSSKFKRKYNGLESACSASKDAITLTNAFIESFQCEHIAAWPENVWFTLAKDIKNAQQRMENLNAADLSLLLNFDPACVWETLMTKPCLIGAFEQQVSSQALINRFEDFERAYPSLSQLFQARKKIQAGELEDTPFASFQHQLGQFDAHDFLHQSFEEISDEQLFARMSEAPDAYFYYSPKEIEGFSWYKNLKQKFEKVRQVLNQPLMQVLLRLIRASSVSLNIPVEIETGTINLLPVLEALSQTLKDRYNGQVAWPGGTRVPCQQASEDGPVRHVRLPDKLARLVMQLEVTHHECAEQPLLFPNPWMNHQDLHVLRLAPIIKLICTAAEGSQPRGRKNEIRDLYLAIQAEFSPSSGHATSSAPSMISSGPV